MWFAGCFHFISQFYSRKRHDKLKIFLYKLCLWAGFETTCEVYGEFARFISTNSIVESTGKTQQQTWNGLKVKVRQGCVPDLKVKGDKAMKGSALTALGEVKTLNAGQRYTNGPKSKKRCVPVNKRQGQIHTEYIRKARKIDENTKSCGDASVRCYHYRCTDCGRGSDRWWRRGS